MLIVCSVCPPSVSKGNNPRSSPALLSQPDSTAPPPSTCDVRPPSLLTTVLMQAATRSTHTAWCVAGASRVTVRGWEDGQPMQRELDDPDRWAVQACESVRLCSLPPPTPHTSLITHANNAGGLDAGSKAALSHGGEDLPGSTTPQNSKQFYYSLKKNPVFVVGSL